MDEKMINELKAEVDDYCSIKTDRDRQIGIINVTDFIEDIVDEEVDKERFKNKMLFIGIITNLRYEEIINDEQVENIVNKLRELL